MFGPLKKLFGGKITSIATSRAALYSKDHPAAKEIAEAEKIAAEKIDMKVYGDRTNSSIQTTTSFDSVNYMRIKAILDRALEKCPNDVDLLYARCSLHYFVGQNEDGMK